VFSSIVAKVSTLAFSEISESFFATAAKEAPEEIQLTFLPLWLL
jgi:hypothetical protein